MQRTSKLGRKVLLATVTHDVGIALTDASEAVWTDASVHAHEESRSLSWRLNVGMHQRLEALHVVIVRLQHKRCARGSSIG